MIFFLSIGQLVFLCNCVYEWRCLRRLQKALGHPGIGATGSCELSKMSGGPKLGSFERAASIHNCWAISDFNFGWPGTHDVAQPILKLPILPILSAEIRGMSHHVSPALVLVLFIFLTLNPLYSGGYYCYLHTGLFPPYWGLSLLKTLL